MPLRVKHDGRARLNSAVKALRTLQVLVGIPAATTVRQPDPDDPSPLTNAQIGYLMETGSPANNLPARPFLGPGVASVQDKIADRLGAAARAALSGDVAAVEKGLTAVGLIAEAAVKAKITEGDFAALAPSTIAKRKARGRTSEKPLTDTGQLRNAVTHVIRPTNGR